MISTTANLQPTRCYRMHTLEKRLGVFQLAPQDGGLAGLSSKLHPSIYLILGPLLILTSSFLLYAYASLQNRDRRVAARPPEEI